MAPAPPQAKIVGFIGQYRFLSNFYPSVVSYHGIMWPTVEHAFQAAKATTDQQRQWILGAKRPGVAKARGRKIDLRPDWEEVKFDIMLQLLRRKFSLTDLRSKLLSTQDRELLEDNNWGDRFWGTVDGKGENHLGRLLMQVRDEVRNDYKGS